VLRPYPSSPLYPQLRDQGRLFHDPWWLQPLTTRMAMVHGLTANVSGAMTTFRPAQMTARQLAEGTLWVGQEFYRFRNSVPRLVRNWPSTPPLILDAWTTYSSARESRSFDRVSPPL